jgi:hypothetical protein
MPTLEFGLFKWFTQGIGEGKMESFVPGDGRLGFSIRNFASYPVIRTGAKLAYPEGKS